MDAIASQVTSLKIVYSSVYSGADQTKHQSPASLAFLRGIHRSPVNFPHKGPVTREMFPFNDVIMSIRSVFCELSFWLRHGWNHTPQNTGFVIIFPHPNLMLFIGEKNNIGEGYFLYHKALEAKEPLLVYHSTKLIGQIIVWNKTQFQAEWSYFKILLRAFGVCVTRPQLL